MRAVVQDGGPVGYRQGLPPLDPTAKVTGLGGAFFRSADAPALLRWYREHLGIAFQDGPWHVFQWREREDPQRPGSTVLALFEHDTTYFGPDNPAFMLNFRVDDLDALITRLRAEGVSVAEERHEDDNGRFAWITDPEGHRIELWEPAAGR